MIAAMKMQPTIMAQNALHRLTVDDWVLTESFRRLEERTGRQPDDVALAIARESGGDLAARVRARAAALDQAPAVRADIRRLRGGLAAIGLGLAVLGLVLGALAARVVVVGRQVEILLAAAALLLVPSLLLIGWAVFMLLSRRRRGGGAAGGLALGLLGRLGSRLLASPLAADIMAAFAGTAATAWGRWRLSAITHAFWLAYAVGALAMLTVLFSIVQYDLSWGSTLLSDRAVVALVKALAWWPELLGLMPAADPAWIAAGREGALDPAARADWARFLLAMIGAWAIVPRALLLLLSLLVAAAAGRRMRLDTGRPGYLRLAADLAPAVRRPAPEERPLPEPQPVPARSRRAGARGIVTVAVELEREPPDLGRLLPGSELIDLGRADDRAGRAAALEAAGELPCPAAGVIGLCSMLRTPDTLTERFLTRLAESADAPLWLVLDEDGRLAARGGDPAARQRDWQTLAERAGAGIVFIDSEAPKAAELARLRRFLDDEQAVK